MIGTVQYVGHSDLETIVHDFASSPKINVGEEKRRCSVLKVGKLGGNKKSSGCHYRLFSVSLSSIKNLRKNYNITVVFS